MEQNTLVLPLTTAQDLESLGQYFGVERYDEKGVEVLHASILAGAIKRSVRHAILETLSRDVDKNTVESDKLYKVKSAELQAVWHRKLDFIRARFTRLSPAARTKALKYLQHLALTESDDEGFGDQELGDLLTMSHDALQQHENHGLHPVSGIMNSNRFRQFFKVAMQRWNNDKEQEEDRREIPQELFLVFIDLDNFKAVNDEINYEAGNFILREFGAYLQEYAEACGGYASHWGGDEFVIFAPTQGSAEDFPAGWQQRLNAIEDTDYIKAGIPLEKINIIKAVTTSFGGAHLATDEITNLKLNFDEAYSGIEAQAARIMKQDKDERKAGR